MNLAPAFNDALRLEWKTTAENSTASPLYRALARAQMHAADGDLSQARNILRQALAGHRAVAGRYGARFQVVLAALRCQEFAVISSYLTRSSGYAPAMEFAVQTPGDPARNQNTFVCTMSASGLHFEMPASAYVSPHLTFLVSRWIATLPMFERCFADGNLRPGRIALNLGDFGRVPGLAFCTNSDDYALIPDSEFLKSDGYADVRKHFAKRPVPWANRRQVAFWRGATTGIELDPALGWRSKPRIKLCEIARDTHPELFDVGISTLVLLPNHPARAALPQSGLMRPYVGMEHFQEYRYQIDIDGHTSAWGGLFQKLLTGCPVLKVQSAQGWRQWYYDRLLAWENFVPVDAGMGDLVEKVRWLVDHDDVAERIGRAGRALAVSLTYDAEVAIGAVTIGNALRE